MRQHLAQRNASAQAHGIARNATAAATALGKFGDRLRGLVLHELTHVVADHAHADFLIKDLLQLFGQGDVLDRHAVQLQADFGELRRELGGEGLRKHELVRGQVQERNAAAGNGVADVLQHQAAQLTIDFGRAVAGARAGYFSVEQLGVVNAEVVITKGAQAHRAKVFVADGDGLGRTPLLVDLLARAEEIHLALERRLKQLVPVFQIGEHRQRLRGELVSARAKHIGRFAFVHKQRHLRFAHGERSAVLNLQIRHGEAPGQRSVRLFSPLNDVNKLLLDEVHQRHGKLLFVEKGKLMIPAQ